jgi:hypothetical protein
MPAPLAADAFKKMRRSHAVLARRYTTGLTKSNRAVLSRTCMRVPCKNPNVVLVMNVTLSGGVRR